MSFSNQPCWKYCAVILGTAVLLGAAEPPRGAVIPDRATLDAILGAGAITEDFESFVVIPGGYAVLAAPRLDETTFVGGQGPGLVQPGAAYVSGSGGASDRFIWFGDGHDGLPTKTISSFIALNVPTTLTIEYAEPVLAMGVDLLDHEGYAHTTTVSVFDPGGTLLDSVDLVIDGATPVFFGYQAPAIGSVHITGNPVGWSTVIDKHTYGGRHKAWLVNDVGVADTELLSVGLDGGEVEVVSPQYPDADIEATCYFGDQIVGAKGEFNGGADLVTMDFVTGEIAFFAHIDFGGLATEIVGMSADGNGVVWGYFEDVGFAIIEVAGDVGTFSVEIGCEAIEALDIGCGLIEGLAVSTDGRTLYAMVRDGRIVAVDILSGVAEVLADFRGMFLDDDIENLELIAEDELAFVTENGNNFYFATVNTATGDVSSAEFFSFLGLEDIESLIIPVNGGRALPLGACSYAEDTCGQMTQADCTMVGGHYCGDFTECPLPCPEDLDWNGNVDVPDLLVVLAAWGTNQDHPADFDGDGNVGAADCLSLLAAWGSCAEPNQSAIPVPGSAF